MKFKFKFKTLIATAAAVCALGAATAMTSAATVVPRSLDWDGDNAVSMTDLVAAAKAHNSVEMAEIKYILLNKIEINFESVTTGITTTTTGNTTTTVTTDITMGTTTDITTTDITAVDPGIIPTEGNVIVMNYNSITYTGDAEADVNGSYITIKEPGDYELFGVLTDGRIIVDVDKDLYPDGKVSLKLNGVNISSADGPAILCNEIDDKLVINSSKDTENFLADGSLREVEGELDGAIYCDGDLNLKGKGLLKVTGVYSDGIVSTKDIEVKTGANIDVTAQDDGIRGKNSVTLEDEDGTGFTLKVLAIDGDALKATVTDKEDKGYVEIQGGNTTLEAQNDEGIQAATNVIISGGVVNITATAGNGIKTELGTVIINGETADVTINAYKDGIQAEGAINVNAGSLNITTTMEQPAKTESQLGRPNRLPPGSTEQTTTDETTSPGSSKGLKSALAVNVTGGIVTINATDDAINSDMNVTINGGKLVLRTGDDAIHAEEVLAIMGENDIDVYSSYEGLEAKEIYISAGDVNVTATNDGVNAAGGNDSSESGLAFGGFEQGVGKFVMTGGTLYVDALGDGIDSNGTLEITGGSVTVIGPTSSMNGIFDVGDFGGKVVIAGTAEVFGIATADEMPVSIEGDVFTDSQWINDDAVILVRENGSIVKEVLFNKALSGMAKVIYSNEDIRTNGLDGYSVTFQMMIVA